MYTDILDHLSVDKKRFINCDNKYICVGILNN